MGDLEKVTQLLREASPKVDRLVAVGHAPHCAMGIVLRKEKCSCGKVATCETKHK